jgi:hypothetical protein
MKAVRGDRAQHKCDRRLPSIPEERRDKSLSSLKNLIHRLHLVRFPTQEHGKKAGYNDCLFNTCKVYKTLQVSYQKAERDPAFPAPIPLHRIGSNA